jgi:transcription initiation factor IIE alpha subunit
MRMLTLVLGLLSTPAHALFIAPTSCQSGHTSFDLPKCLKELSAAVEKQDTEISRLEMKVNFLELQLQREREKRK